MLAARDLGLPTVITQQPTWNRASLLYPKPHDKIALSALRQFAWEYR